MSRQKGVEVFFWLSGLVILCVGVSLVVQADWGVTSLISLPYVMGRRFSFFSLGVWSYITQGMMVILLILIVRKIKLSYFLSFAVSVGYGYLLDLFTWLFRNLGNTPLERAGLFFAGLVLMWIGIGFFMGCSLPLMPYDIFVREFIATRGGTIRKVKTILDLSFVIAACVLSYLFFSSLQGVGVGTVLSAAVMGTGAGFVHHKVEKYIHPTASPAILADTEPGQ